MVHIFWWQSVNHFYAVRTEEDFTDPSITYISTDLQDAIDQALEWADDSCEVIYHPNESPNLEKEIYF